MSSCPVVGYSQHQRQLDGTVAVDKAPIDGKGCRPRKPQPKIEVGFVHIGLIIKVRF